MEQVTPLPDATGLGISVTDVMADLFSILEERYPLSVGKRYAAVSAPLRRDVIASGAVASSSVTLKVELDVELGSGTGVIWSSCTELVDWLAIFDRRSLSVAGAVLSGLLKRGLGV